LKQAAYCDKLQQLGRVVYSMERFGVPIDREVCAEIRDHATHDGDETKKRLDALAGTLTGATATNWNYHGWLAPFLYDPKPGGLGLAPSIYCTKGRVKDGKLTTDGTALDWLASQHGEYREVLNLIRMLRQQRRVANYAAGWLELAVQHPDGSWRLHPSFGMASDADTRPGAKTGRFGIKNPALQQVPNDPRKDPYRLRRAFIAAPGHTLVVADYSQLEIVVMAHLCYRLFGATGLRDRLYPGQPDMHSSTAQYVFGQVIGIPEAVGVTDLSLFKSDPVLHRLRDQIKRVRYGLAYLKGAYGFGNTLFEWDAAGNIIGPPVGEERAQELIDALLGMDPEVKWLQDWIWEYGYEQQMMPSLQGRWDPGPQIRSKDKWVAKRKYRQWANWPMQAGAQEVVLETMIQLFLAGIQMSLQVHDELHMMVPEDLDLGLTKAKIREVGENSTKLDAPLTFKPGHGLTWEEAK
jgi:DNA polymerase-1